jgi:DNA-directed RNA polymerase sigma subunit (sigma70/sigma32)
VLEALQASVAYRATSLETPRAGEDGAGDTLGDTVASTEQGFGLAEDRATLAQLLRAITPREREVLRLRGGPHPTTDRPTHRRLADADLAHHPPLDRPPAHGRACLTTRSVSCPRVR